MNKGISSRIYFFLASMGLASLVLSSVPSFATETSYYFGKMSFFFLDGTLEKQVDSLIKREVDADKGLITEINTQPADPKDPKSFAKDITTVISKKDGQTFSAEDTTTHSFSGSMTYLNETFTEWTYNLTLKAGGTITGIGSISPSGVSTTKILLIDSPYFQMHRVVQDRLAPITENDYTAKRNEIFGIQ